MPAASCRQAKIHLGRRASQFADSLLHGWLRAGDYSFAFTGLQAAVKVITPVGIEVDLGVALKQLAFSKRGAIDPAVYPNLNLPSTFWTPQ